MKADVLNTQATKVGQIDLPIQFTEQVRHDIIKRAFLSSVSKNRTPYGAFSRAGQRHSADLSRRRRDYKGSYGKGISRAPRKALWRRGGQFGWVGAIAPGTVGGRRAHPPKSSKIFYQKINQKERKKAILCAISATVNKDFIKKRNHLFTDNLPLVLNQDFENIKKTKDLQALFNKIGLQKALEHSRQKTLRPGKGKLRSRKYKKKTGPLIVVSKKSDLFKAAKNLPGFDICTVNSLNIKLLAPGAAPGRFTIWSVQAIERLSKEKLYLQK